MNDTSTNILLERFRAVAAKHPSKVRAARSPFELLPLGLDLEGLDPLLQQGMCCLARVQKELRPKCTECPRDATVRLNWPGKPLDMCLPCGNTATNVAALNGFNLTITPLAEVTDDDLTNVHTRPTQRP